jgi:hypothetical protein
MNKSRIKFDRMLLVLLTSVLFCAPAIAAPISIEFTTDGLGLTLAPGETKGINQQANGSLVEADRVGQLVTSTAANVGSVLTIQDNGLAGLGTGANPLLVTLTARSYLDIQENLPPNYDIHAGVISLTTNNPDIAKEGLGVRAFGIDTDIASPNYGKRYNDGAGNVFQMEGSKEVSGGADYTDWNDFVLRNDVPPDNSPPHVDEDVKFDFNNSEFSMAADSIKVLLTKITAGSDHDPFDLSITLTINLVGGEVIEESYDYLSDALDVFSLYDGYDDVIVVDFSGASLGLKPSDIIDSFIIGAQDDIADPVRGTDEHFLINSLEVTAVPEPASICALSMGALFLLRKRRDRK